MTHNKIAFIFPGQGAQYVGMGKEIYEARPGLQPLFDSMASLLDFDLKNVCFNGPEDRLNRTDYSQPAIFAVSVLCAEALKQECPLIHVDCTAGLSLGEYTALCFAGAISWQEGLKLVYQRGQFMNAASQTHPGSMASIIGLDLSTIERLCHGLDDDHYVGVANLNCPGQVVVSGTIQGIEQFCPKALEAGARKAIPLAVSGAFHSPLMQEASQKLSDVLAHVSFDACHIPVVSNVTADIVGENGAASQLLSRQVCEAVLWEKSIRSMIERGVDLFVECGPGKVLKGLIRRIDKTKSVINVDSFQDFQETVKILS